jgi:hypothetical protein
MSALGFFIRVVAFAVAVGASRFSTCFSLLLHAVTSNTVQNMRRIRA